MEEFIALALQFSLLIVKRKEGKEKKKKGKKEGKKKVNLQRLANKTCQVALWGMFEYLYLYL